MRKFFAPSHFVADDQGNRVRLFWSILVIAMVAITAESVIDLLANRDVLIPSLVLIILFDATGLILYLLSTRGFVRLSSYALVFLLWLVTTWLNIGEGGIYAPTLDIAYLVIIVIAGLLLGETAGLITGGLCTFSMLALALTAIYTRESPNISQSTPMMIFWEDFVFVVIVVGLQFLTTTALKGALNQAHLEIVERRKTEADLVRAKEYAENLIQAANAIIMGLDQQGHVTVFNRAAEKITGYTRQELANQVWLDLSVPTERYPKIWEELNRTLTSGYPRTFENPIVTKNGEERIISWQNTRIGEEIISFGIDVTEQKKLEQARVHDQAELEVQRLLANQREGERTRIARDLHDGPVQELVGITFSLKGMIDDAQGSPLQPDLLSIQSTVQKLIDTLRAYAGELRPPTLMKFGLSKAILSHLDDFHEKHPEIDVEFDATPEEQLLPEDIRLALFRIYQEAMNNILRHAEANRVIVRLHIEDTEALLEIQDNGVGFTPPDEWMELARNKHLGLVGMRERVESIGGRMTITSQKGIGTGIHVSVPHPQSNPENNQTLSLG